MDMIIVSGVAAKGLRHVFEPEAVVQVEGEPMSTVELKWNVYRALGWGQVDARLPEVIGHAKGATESVEAVIGQFGGTVGEVGESEGSHRHELSGDTLPVFEGEVDSSIDVLPDGKVVIIVEIVETLG